MHARLAGQDEATAPRVGRYRVVEKIGEGAMGVVYRAHDPDLDRTVALKVIRGRPDVEHKALLRGEAQALARLTHPNVVSVHDIGVEEGQVYVTMEFVTGGTLAEWLAEPTARSWRDIVVLFVEAGRGLDAAHQEGVVHRDFKAANVLLGEGGRVKVADFGLAHMVTPSASEPSAFQTRSVAGTPGYIAPETVASGVATFSSDQYAFCRALERALRMRDTQGVGQSEPDDLWALVNTGLAEEPQARHRSMRDLLAGLERVLVAPVSSGRREVLLERIEAVVRASQLSSALLEMRPISLSLVEVPELVDGEAMRVLSTSDGRALDDTGHLPDVYERADGGLLIVGLPGSGKTTAMQQLALDLVQRARRDTARPVPVLLNLSSLGQHSGPIETWLANEIHTKYGIPRRESLARLRQEAWVLLLDGLDELRPDRLAEAITAINTLRAAFPCRVVATARDDAYANAPLRLDVRSAVRLVPLDERRAREFLGELRPGLAAQGLDVDRGERARLETPLLLSLAASSTANWPADASESQVRGQLYADYLEHTLRDTPAPDRARMLAALGWMARQMRERGLSEFWLERLQADWLEGRARTAALWLGVLLVAVVVIGGNLLATLISGRELQVGLVLGPATFPVVLLFNRGLRVRPIDELRWSWRRTLRWLPAAMLATTVVGGLYGLLYEFWNNVLAGLAAGLIVALPLGLESGDEVVGLAPNRGIRRSGRNALVIGGSVFVLAGILLGPVLLAMFMPSLGPDSEFLHLAHPYWASFWVSAAVVAIPAGMAAGGTAVVLHLAVRLVLAMQTPMPLRLVPFLEEAVQHGLLRRIGGGYVFVHRTLLDHLAGRTRPGGAGG